MPRLVGQLLATAQQLVVIEQLGGVLHDGLVGAVVLTQEDLARMLGGVEIVETLQEGDVEVALPGKG